MNGAEQKGMQAGARSWVGKKKQDSGLGDRNVGPTGIPGLLIPAPRQGGPSGLNHRRYGATNSRMEGETPAGQGLLSARLRLLHTLMAPPSGISAIISASGLGR